MSISWVNLANWSVLYEDKQCSQGADFWNLDSISCTAVPEVGLWAVSAREECKDNFVESRFDHIKETWVQHKLRVGTADPTRCSAVHVACQKNGSLYELQNWRSSLN